jgi:hypothetical protein
LPRLKSAFPQWQHKQSRGEKMTVLEQFQRILRSRKFWVLIAALLTTLAAYMTSELTVWQALQAVVAALAVYSTGVAIEDSGNASPQR